MKPLKCRDYKILEAPTIAELEALVQTCLDIGYVPQGGIITRPTQSYGEVLYAQSVALFYSAEDNFEKVIPPKPPEIKEEEPKKIEDVLASEDGDLPERTTLVGVDLTDESDKTTTQTVSGSRAKPLGFGDLDKK